LKLRFSNKIVDMEAIGRKFTYVFVIDSETSLDAMHQAMA